MPSNTWCMLNFLSKMSILKSGGLNSYLSLSVGAGVQCLALLRGGGEVGILSCIQNSTSDSELPQATLSP